MKKNNKNLLLCDRRFVSEFRNYTNINLKGFDLKEKDRIKSGGLKIEEVGDEILIYCDGYIFSQSNVFTEYFNFGFSIDALDFAVEKYKDKNIMLVFDSPGGEADGVYELAEKIYNQNEKINCYVKGLAASGAYWLASSCNNIYSSKTATVGSIGVVITIYKYNDEEEKEIVSNISPLKRQSKGGEKYYDMLQDLVDDMADIFIEAVARNRKVEKEYALENFGQGGLIIAEKALKKKMVNKIKIFEKKDLTSQDDNIMSPDIKNELEKNTMFKKGKTENEKITVTENEVGELNKDEIIETLQIKVQELETKLEKSNSKDEHEKKLMRLRKMQKFCSTEEQKKFFNEALLKIHSKEDDYDILEASMELLSLKEKENLENKRAADTMEVQVTEGNIEERSEQEQWHKVAMAVAIKKSGKKEV